MTTAGLRPRTVIVGPERRGPDVPPALSDTDRLLATVERLLASVQQSPTVEVPPVPPLVVAPPDLSAIVTAVNGLRPGADAETIAAAITATLGYPASQADITPALEKLGDVLRGLEFRMQAPNAVVGGGILHMAPEQVDVNGNVKVTTPPVGVDANNTTTSPLAANASFVGTATDISRFDQVNIELFGLPSTVQGSGSNARATLFFEFSPDAANWDVSVPVLVRDPGLFIPYPLINVGRYFRLRYLNDGGQGAATILGLPAALVTTPQNQTQFRLTTQLLPSATKELARTLDQGVSGSDPVALTRSALMGEAADGSIQNIDVKLRPDLTYALKVDAAGGDRTVFGSQFSEAISDDVTINFASALPVNLVNVATANGGTVTQAAAQALLQTSTAANGAASITSQQTTSYRPGHEVRADFTATFTAGVTGATQYVGLFDANNGFFIGFNGVTFGVVQRSAGVDTTVTQAAWNGTMLTEFTRNGVVEPVDFTKGNVYRIRFGWLGNAVINFEVMSPDGFYVLMHQVKFPNTSTTASIQNPNLPVQAAVAKTSGASNVTLRSSSWRAGSMGATSNISIVNSPAVAPLTANSVYTSAWYASTNVNAISLLITTDVISAVNGVDVQFSDNASTVRGHQIFSFRSANVTDGALFQVFPPHAEFFRIVYTNGANNQTSFFVNLNTSTGPYQSNNPQFVTTAIGTYGGAAGTSGTVNVPAGAQVTGATAVAGNVNATVTVPGITGTVQVPGSNQQSDSINIQPPPGTMIGPVTFVFSLTAAYVVEWVL